MTAARLLLSVLREKGSDDHFYGAWTGGSKAEGGGPATARRLERTPSEVETALERVKGQGIGSGWQPPDDRTFDGFMDYVHQPWSGNVKVYGDHLGEVMRADYTPEEGGGWKSVAMFKDGGRVVGYLVVTKQGPGGQPEVEAVAVRRGMTGKHIGTRMYDWVQDHAGPKAGIDLYDCIGRSGEFTERGKAFAESWLNHRIALESAT